MARDEPPALQRVEVVYSPAPRVVDCVHLTLAAGATLADALSASGLPARHGLDLSALRFGIWGRPRPAETVLRDRDRVEIWRALLVDPKEARRQRYRKHRDAGGADGAAGISGSRS